MFILLSQACDDSQASQVGSVYLSVSPFPASPVYQFLCCCLCRGRTACHLHLELIHYIVLCCCSLGSYVASSSVETHFVARLAGSSLSSSSTIIASKTNQF